MHLNPPTLIRSVDSLAAPSWDPRDSISSLADNFNIVAVLPLIDSVVPQCDMICRKLGLRGNDPSTSLTRVDKEQMQSALGISGISSARSRRVSSVNEAISVWQTEFNSKPVVLKPPRSGGCDGVSVCSTILDVTSHFQRHLHVLNLERIRNTEMIMQELIEMDYEYVVNTVSVGGHHFVCDVWRGKGKRNGKQFIYDTQELVVDLDGIRYIIDYTKSVLTAVGVIFGACHTELGVRYSNDRGASVYLIEVNPRLAGEIRTSDDIPGWNGRDQIYWLLTSIVDPAVLLERGIPKSLSSPDNTVIVVFLRNLKFHTCLIVEKGLNALRGLRSFSRFGRGLVWANDSNADRPTTRYTKTTDLVSSPGVVILMGPTAHYDAMRVRQIEETYLYQPLHVL